ncbi:MAG: prepilin peptidase [Burkholderiaceae bacterium]|nr:prepilin peptidase [Burkholderiaceae bacterium]
MTANLVFLLLFVALSCWAVNALVVWVPLRLAEEERAESNLTTYWSVLVGFRLAGILSFAVVALQVAVFGLCYWRLGPGVPLIVWAIFYWALIALAAIDLKTTFLPDILTLPLLWLGLVIQLWPASRTVGPELAIAGAVLGYLPLYLLAQAFLAVRKREGLGFGDLKLVAAIGAWIGPWPLPWILVIASLAALVWAGVQALSGRKGLMQSEFPFGPWIALATFAFAISGMIRTPVGG